MYCRTFFLFLLFSCFISSVFAQTMSFANILNAYHLDSSAARQFCTGKSFALSDVKHDGATTRYQYKAGDSINSVRLEISYPNDSTSLNVQINYWFGSAKDYNGFKEAFRKNGFTRHSVKDVSGSVPAHAERYISKNLQIELIHPGDKQPYWLFLHPVGNYIW